MRYLTLVFILLQAFTWQKTWRHLPMPDPIPEELRDCYEKDTLLTDYWVISTEHYIVKPTVVYYITQPDMKHYKSWPSVEEATKRAYKFWNNNTDSIVRSGCKFFDDGEVRVFVYIKRDNKVLYR